VTWGDQQLEVLSVKQPLKLRGDTDSEILATFKDGQPAVVTSRVGRGTVFTLGFLPALSYIKPALIARRPLEQKADADRVTAEKLAAAAADQPLATSAAVSSPKAVTVHSGSEQEILERSDNPWQYPAGIRDRLLIPVHAAKVLPKLKCDTPLIDAVALPCEQGTLIALSNFTQQPQDRVRLELITGKPVTRVESVRHGVLASAVEEAGKTVFTLPLDASDFVMVTHEPKELRVGKTTDESRTQFAAALASLLAELKQSRQPQPTIIVRSLFLPDAEKDKLMKQVSTDAGVIFVDISKLSVEEANYARSARQIEHVGVAGHPGDKGMQVLADELWNALKQAGEVKD